MQLFKLNLEYSFKLHPPTPPLMLDLIVVFSGILQSDFECRSVWCWSEIFSPTYGGDGSDFLYSRIGIWTRNGTPHLRRQRGCWVADGLWHERRVWRAATEACQRPRFSSLLGPVHSNKHSHLSGDPLICIYTCLQWQRLFIPLGLSRRTHQQDPWFAPWWAPPGWIPSPMTQAKPQGHDCRAVRKGYSHSSGSSSRIHPRPPALVRSWRNGARHMWEQDVEYFHSMCCRAYIVTA